MHAHDVHDGTAADLRVTLNLLLSEHIIFAAKATDAALGGRMDEFDAYGALLDTNGTDVGALVGAAFGEAAETTFNSLWSAHNGLFVVYTTAVAAKDANKQQEAVDGLTSSFVPGFAELLSGATGLPRDAVTELTQEHVLNTKAIVDAQAAKDWSLAYEATRMAFAHMQMMADPLSEAIAKKLPDAFSGDPTSKALSLRVALNQLLQEHMYLATFATGAALGGRSAEFAAAGAALDANGADLGSAIGGLYGREAEAKFEGLWRAHNGFFVDYTTGVASHDEAKQQKALEDLQQSFVPQFAAFLAGATDLPESALTSLTSGHLLATQQVVELQGEQDVEAASAADRKAAQHMAMMADPLAAAIVAKLPSKF